MNWCTPFHVKTWLTGPHSSSSSGEPTSNPVVRSRLLLDSQLDGNMEDRADSMLSNANGNHTIVHRPSQQKSPIPFIDTQSSSVPSRHNATWSPADTASTTATSWTSPPSSGPKTRNQNQSKSASGGVDESLSPRGLPPIQEDSGRCLMIPVQESEVDATPSVSQTDFGPSQ